MKVMLMETRGESWEIMRLMMKNDRNNVKRDGRSDVKRDDRSDVKRDDRSNIER
jgi:hypothetical protein